MSADKIARGSSARRSPGGSWLSGHRPVNVNAAWLAAVFGIGRPNRDGSVGRVLIPDMKRRRIGPERITTFPVRICVCRPFWLLGRSKALCRYFRRRNKTKIAHSRRALIEAFRNSLRISSVWVMCLATSERMKPVTGSQSARWRNICYVNEPFGEALPCRRKLGEHGSFHGLIFNRAVIRRPVNRPPSGFSPAAWVARISAHIKANAWNSAQ